MAKELDIIGLIVFMLSQKEEVSNIEIRELKYKIGKEFGYSMETSRDDLYDCAIKWKEMLEWFEGGMRRSVGSEIFFNNKPYLKHFFSVFLPEKVLAFLKEEYATCPT